MSQTRIPVKYVGPKATDVDHIYGSGITFRRGKISQVPDWAAAGLLRHPEFEDMRPKDERGMAIVAKREVTQEDIDKELDELDQMQSNIRLDSMTRDQMSAYAMRTFGVRVDPTGLKAEVTNSVRTLMQTRGVR